MVKNVVKKMHGLNVIQVINTGALNGSATTNSGTDQTRRLNIMDVDSPSNLQDLNIFDGGRQVYFKRITACREFHNVGATSVRFMNVVVRARKDTPVSGSWPNINTMVTQLLNDGIPYTYNYASPFTSNKFQKMFKILSTKRKLLRPGRLLKYRVKAYVPNRPYTEQVEANSDEWLLRRGNKLLLTFTQGVPYFLFNDYTTVNLGNQSCTIVDHLYFSYYQMDDVEPTSTITSALPLTRAGDLQSIATQNESAMFLQYIANQTMPNPAPTKVIP